jgi:hypothetical protein
VKNKLLAVKHCYLNKSCAGCPYENSPSECENLNETATKLLAQLLEHFDIDTLANIARRFIKEDKDYERNDKT